MHNWLKSKKKHEIYWWKYSLGQPMNTMKWKSVDARNVYMSEEFSLDLLLDGNGWLQGNRGIMINYH